MFRLGWDHVDAKLIDQRFLRRGDYNVNTPGSYQVWEYLVEIAEPGREPVRLPDQEKTFKVDLPEVGGTVPVLVNRKRDEARFAEKLGRRR